MSNNYCDANFGMRALKINSCKYRLQFEFLRHRKTLRLPSKDQPVTVL
jgi:hypothetical protein